MSNIVFTVNIENPDNPRRCKPYQVSIDSWKVWAKKNDCEVFILDQWVYDKGVMNPNWHKLLVFDLLENSGIEYDQVLIVDSDTYIHPDAPNIFEETDNKFCAVHNDGSYDWVMRSMETYSKHVFEGYMFDWSEYFNSGVMVVNKEHKTLFKDILEFYLTNQELVSGIQKNYGVGTDQPMINFFVQKNNVDLKLLPYKWNMQDLHRKEILRDDMLFTELGWVYHFNAIPKNSNSYKTWYWLEKTKLYFSDSPYVMTNKISVDMWMQFLSSLDEELETWKPDRQALSEEEYAAQMSQQEDGFSPPIFLVSKKDNQVIAAFLASYKAIGISLSLFDEINNGSCEYDNTVSFIHNYVVRKDYQKMGIAKKFLKMSMDFLTQVNSFFDKEGRPMTHHVDFKTMTSKDVYWPDRNIFHFARTHDYNDGSRNLCKSLGFEETKVGNKFVYKLEHKF